MSKASGRFKKVTFSPAQPRRAKTRRFHGQGLNCLLRPAGRDPCACQVPQGVTIVLRAERTPRT